MRTDPVIDHRRALCCDCGRLRYVKTGARPRGYRPEPFDLGAEGPEGDRCVMPLKCATCKSLTTHAWLRDHDRRYADWLEVRQLRGVEYADYWRPV